MLGIHFDFKKKNKENGAVLVFVALLLIVFVGIAALALDIGHLYVVRNELQNAADAGALAGADSLYIGTAVNSGANQIAADTATQNQSERAAVELVFNAAANSGDVQRGHWNPLTRNFSANDSLAPYDPEGLTEEQIYADTNWINAVKVRVRRQDTPAASFFARIFGYADFAVSAEAIAYMGYAASFGPGELDQPIAICEDTVKKDGVVSCNIGRMINSGSNETNNETGGWTDFNQDNPCSGGTNASIMDDLICSGGNPDNVTFGLDMATNGGQIASAYTSFRDCWNSESIDPDTGLRSSWNVTLPMVTCPSNNMGTCEKLVGAINVNIVWITDVGTDPGYNNVPTQVDDWPDDAIPDSDGDGDVDGEDRWADFVDHFNLKNVDGSDAPYQKKAIYFKPECELAEPKGTTGGGFSNVPANAPVLVH